MCKRILAVLSCALMAVGACGCWDSRELSDIAVVVGIAVDSCEEVEGGGITLDVQVAKPKNATASSAGTGGASSGGSSFHADFSESGDNVAEIFRSITHLSSRRLYSAHNQIIIFGRELAEGMGVEQAVDYFLRDNELRYSVLLAVADGRAADALSTTAIFEELPAAELAELIKNQASNSGSAICTLDELAKAGMSEGTTALVPIIKLREGAPKENSGEKEQNCEVTGAAVFKGSKMVGELSAAETRGALWVRGDVSRAVIDATLDGNVNASAEVFDCRATFDVNVYGNERAVADVKCNVYANIAQLTNYRGAINDELAEKLADACERTVTEEIKAAHKKSAEFGCDVFGFGNRLYSRDYKSWQGCKENWQTLFADMELNIEVTVRIEDVGDLTAEIPWQSADEQKDGE